jgi:anti-anti-sigma regulatory factor
MIDFKAEESGNNTILTISGELTIQNASALQGIFIRSLESSSNLTVNLEGVTDLDLSFLQMLCSLHRTSTDLKKNLALTGRYPEIFRDAVKSAGYSRRSGCGSNNNKNCLWAEMNKDPEKETN